MHARLQKHFQGANIHLNKPCSVLEILGSTDEFQELQSSIRNQLPPLVELLNDSIFRKWVHSGQSDLPNALAQLTLALQRRAGIRGHLCLVLENGIETPIVVAIESIFPNASLLAAEFAHRLILNRERQKELVREFLVGADERCATFDRRQLYYAAQSRGIPVQFLARDVLLFGQGHLSRRTYKGITDATSKLAIGLASDKTMTLLRLAEVGLPVAQHAAVETSDQAIAIAGRLGFPVVVKPINASKGRGVAVELKDTESVAKAFEQALKFGRVAVENFIQGETFRLLVINNKCVAAATTQPATVFGDGENTVQELVEIENQDKRRGPDHSAPLCWIELDEESHRVLKEQGLSPTAVPEAGLKVRLQLASNLSRGGSSVALTDVVHPENIKLAELAAKTIGLDVAGVDIRARRLDLPIASTGGAIIEINESPGMRMHSAPLRGRAVDVANPMLRMLFPDQTNGTIPTAAVTGTNGKTTTSRLLAHILGQSGLTVGRSTTGEVAVGNKILVTGDHAGPGAARRIFANPAVEAAVLETSRGGIIRWGLGFERCDVAAVLNIADDHIGIDGVETLDDMSRTKSLVAHAATGTLVLNASDHRCLAMANNCAAAKIILFSDDPDVHAVKQHVDAGGVAYVVRGEGATARICRLELNQIRDELSANEIPISFNGSARYNLSNAMAAMAMAEGLGVSTDIIHEAVRSFQPTAEFNPGRLTRLRTEPFEVFLDYCHNLHALEALLPVIDSMPVKGNRICCFGLNAESHSDAKALAFVEMLSGHFDVFFVFNWEQSKKKLREGFSDFLKQCLSKSGVAEGKIEATPREADAIDQALSAAQPGDMVLVLSGQSERRAIHQIENHPVDGSGTSLSRPTSDASTSINLFLSGDIMTGRGVDYMLASPRRPTPTRNDVPTPQERFRTAQEKLGWMPRPMSSAAMWGPALAELERQNPVYRIGNLETSVTGQPLNTSKRFSFAMSPDNVSCLSELGLDFCSLANNHVLDAGISGLTETIDTITSFGIVAAGAGINSREATTAKWLPLGREGRLVFLAVAVGDSGVPPQWSAGKTRPGIFRLPDLSAKTANDLRNHVRQFKRPGDIVILSIHWGGNWGFEISDQQIKFAHELVDDNCVDIIHGHSSHHAKAFEVRSGKLILYGCGDFINDYQVEGREQFRPDLAVMYFPKVDVNTGDLQSLYLKPLKISAFQLHTPSTHDVDWLEEMFNREGAQFGTTLHTTDDGGLLLS